MINAATLIGEPIYFNGIKIYPPKVKDVVANPDFSTFLKLLTISTEDVQELCKDEKRIPTTLEFILGCSYGDSSFEDKAKKAFRFYLLQDVRFSYEDKSIVIEDDNILLNENNFLDFQNKIRISTGLPELQEPPPIDPNEDPRIRRMKEKIRERDRIKARKAAEGKSGGIDLSTTLAAICCMGIGLTPLNIGELSYASVGPIMNMMQEKEKYDLDIRSLLAGASSKKVKPKYWIRNSD